MLTNRHWKRFDRTLLGLTLTLSMIGVVAIYSANMQSDLIFVRELYIKQVYWILISIVAMSFAATIDYAFIERMAFPLYILGVGLLILVTFIGKVGGGSQRWLSLGWIDFQPSEIMKVILVIILARVFNDIKKRDPINAFDLIRPIGFLVVPFFLVAQQPDLGTAIIYVVIFIGLVGFVRVQTKLMSFLSIFLLAVTPLTWFLLKPYQKDRIIGLFNPEEDPMGRGYHIIQSKIAIGSGGMWGKGIFEGTQSKLNFLPAKHTDFIFSVYAEEVGFIGAIVLISLFCSMALRFQNIIKYSEDKFACLVVVGLGAMIIFNFVYNIGMALGLLPIVGIPLPFMSYGGSALITNFICIGLAINVSIGRKRLV